MSKAARKFIAILLAVWLPLFSGSVLAESVSMQLQRGSCHEAAMQKMQLALADNHQHHHAAPGVVHDQSTPDQQKSDQQQDQDGSSCNACGVCHLACSGYLAVPEIKSLVVQQAASVVTHYLFSFHSITSIPLLPPPLVRA